MKDLKKRILILVLLVSSISQGQEITITGKVFDKDGALPGVSVLIKGTTIGADTDFDGEYTIKTNVGDILVYSYLGYHTAERTVTTAEIINVTMKEGGEYLEEIVVASKGKVRIKGIIGVSSLKGSVKGISISDKKYSKPQSGQLTAAEINDLEKWGEWKKLIKKIEFKKVEKNWKFELGEKFEVSIFDENQKPINNVQILFIDNQKKIIQGKTDINGKAIFFKNSSNYFTIQAIYNNKVKGLRVSKNQQKAVFQFDSKSTECKGLDLMFTIDTTGSMGDEIAYLKSELENIISRVDSSIQEKRIALTFYRDSTDDYIVKEFDFTNNINEVKENLSKQNASGGGDYEEAVEVALKKSLSMNWKENSKTRLMFLMLDAPPHLTKENVITLKEQLQKAKSMGIKIIPIVASGANKSVEYLMRYFSVYTNGTYVFLTDDSGIGNKHLKPSTKDFKVEKLNDLIVRLINKYSKA